jgi:hypothetical protein
LPPLSTKAITAYMKFEFSDSEFRAPSQHFIIRAGNKKVCYAYIRKNGCSGFKKLINKTPHPIVKLKKYLGIKTAFRDGYIKNLKYFAIKPEKISDTRFDEILFVYRDPIDRFISVYTNKFLDGGGNKDIKTNYEFLMNKSFSEASFYDFIEYAQNSFADLDCHLWPQKSHLLDISYTKAINLTHLHKSMIDVIGITEADKYFLRKSNYSTVSDIKGVSANLSHISASILKELSSEGLLLNKRCFMSDRLVNFIHEKYQTDYAMINQIEKAPPP